MTGNPPANQSLSVLLVDSDRQFVSRGCELIAADGHLAWGAEDLIAAANFLADQRPDLMLVELDLLEADGADPLGDLRARAPGAPTIISAYGPPDERLGALARVHEIYGYHDKAHGASGLRLWVRAGLKAGRQQRAIRKMRSSLKQLLAATPELHRIQSLDEVLETIMGELRKLLAAEHSFVAARLSDPVGKPRIEGLGDTPPSIDDYVVGAGDHPSYAPGARLDALKSVPTELLRRALEERANLIDDHHGVLPLALAEHVLGLAYLSAPVRASSDADLLRLFSGQAAAAIRNAALYELATVDSTTRVYRKSFTLERLRETIKLAWRKLLPVTVMMVDIDSFKEINDRYGHVVGDHVLRNVGQLLKANVRDSDIVGRFGGDEFLIVLIDASGTGAIIVAERLHAALADAAANGWPHGLPEPHLSMGRVSLEPTEGWPERGGFPDFTHIVERIVSEADSAMYIARREARGLFAAAALTWADFTS